jgi:hypothetical protein
MKKQTIKKPKRIENRSDQISTPDSPFSYFAILPIDIITYYCYNDSITG